MEDSKVITAETIAQMPQYVARGERQELVVRLGELVKEEVALRRSMTINQVRGVFDGRQGEKLAVVLQEIQKIRDLVGLCSLRIKMLDPTKGGAKNTNGRSENNRAATDDDSSIIDEDLEPDETMEGEDIFETGVPFSDE